MIPILAFLAFALIAYVAMGGFGLLAMGAVGIVLAAGLWSEAVACFREAAE